MYAVGKESVMHRLFSKKQILTVPNLLSLVRLLLIPVILWLYIGKQNNYAAIVIIALSGLTDVVDGYIARRFNMVSDLGKILDPIADKLTQGSLILCLTVTYDWMKWLIALFVVKEIAMAVMGLLVIKQKDSVNSAQWHGKLSTVLLYATMIVLIMFPGMPLPVVNTLIVTCAIVIVMSLTLYTKFYIKLFRKSEEHG